MKMFIKGSDDCLLLAHSTHVHVNVNTGNNEMKHSVRPAADDRIHYTFDGGFLMIIIQLDIYKQGYFFNG